MHLKNKKVIVTGGAGVIGRELIALLENEGAFIRCFDIEPRPKSFGDRVEYSQRDLSTLNNLEFIKFNPDVVFHLAATFERSEESEGFWDMNYQNEILLNHNVFDAAKECANLRHFVFASSYLVYNPDLYLKSNPKKSAATLNESSSVNPRNLCGAAKLYAEKELEFFSKQKSFGLFRSTFARIFRVYGKGSHDVISRWVRAALKNESISVFAPQNTFDYIYAGDVAEGLLCIVKNDVRESVVNIGSGKPRSIKEVIRILKKHFPKLRTRTVPKRTLFESSRADISKMKKNTTWRPRTSLETGIQKVIAHERRI